MENLLQDSLFIITHESEYVQSSHDRSTRSDVNKPLSDSNQNPVIDFWTVETKKTKKFQKKTKKDIQRSRSFNPAINTMSALHPALTHSIATIDTSYLYYHILITTSKVLVGNREKSKYSSLI